MTAPFHMPGRKVRAMCRETLTSIGPEATYEQVLERLTSEGLSLTRETFERNYREMFSPTTSTNGEARHVDEGGSLDTARLSEFLKFAVQVEAIGGVERARAFLDVLERLSAVL